MAKLNGALLQSIWLQMFQKLINRMTAFNDTVSTAVTIDITLYDM
jgi:hypothetical protein